MDHIKLPDSRLKNTNLLQKRLKLHHNSLFNVPDIRHMNTGTCCTFVFTHRCGLED